MFLITLFISFITFASGYDITEEKEELKEEKSILSAEQIYDIFIDILHNGIDKSNFLKIFLQQKGFNDTYNQILNTIQNQSLTIEFVNSDSLSSISQFLKSGQSLYSYCPYINSLHSEYKEMMISYKPILLEIAPNFCKAFNLDLNTLIKLYDYILINNEQDGVYLEKVLKILDINTDQIITQFQTFLSILNSKTTIYEIFKMMNVEQQYLQLISSLNEIKIQSNSTNIFSKEKIILILSNTIDLYSHIKSNVGQLIKNIINPFLIKSYDEVSIYDRAQELYELLRKVNSYSEQCSDSDDFIKCFDKYYLYELFEIYIRIFKDDSSNKTEREFFLLVKQNVFDFANKKINITEQKASTPAFNLLKLYIENELKSNYSEFKNEQEQELINIVHYFDNFEKIFKKEEQENVEKLFNALKIQQLYEPFKLFVDKLNEFETFEKFCSFHKTKIIKIIKLVINALPIQQKQNEDQKSELNIDTVIKHYNEYTNEYKHVKQLYKQYQHNCILNNEKCNQNYEKNTKYYEEYVQNYKNYKQRVEEIKQRYDDYQRYYADHNKNYIQNNKSIKLSNKSSEIYLNIKYNFLKFCNLLVCIFIGILTYYAITNIEKTKSKEEMKPVLFIDLSHENMTLYPQQEMQPELHRNHHHRHHHRTKSKKSHN